MVDAVFLGSGSLETHPASSFPIPRLRSLLPGLGPPLYPLRRLVEVVQDPADHRQVFQWVVPAFCVSLGQAGSVPLGVATAGSAVVADALAVGRWERRPLEPGLEAPVSHPGRLEDGLVVGFPGDNALADLVPV